MVTRRTAAWLVTCVLAGWMPGIALASGRGAGTVAPPAKPDHEIVFPPPPAPPRLKWVGAWARIEDIRPPTKGFFRKALNFVLGRSDPAGSMLVRPYGIAARGGIVVVADSEGSAAVAMDPGTGDVWRMGGTVEGRLVSPIGAAIDRAGNIYVSDSIQKVIKVFEPDGDFLLQIGTHDGLGRPTGLAWHDGKDLLIVADSEKSRLVLFDAKGKLVRRIGKRGGGRAELSMPVNVAVDRAGDLLVSDPMLGRIQTFSVGGKHLRTFGERGSTPGYLPRPRGVAADSDGNLWVADAMFNAVQAFRPDGSLLIIVGGQGAAPAAFDLPAGLCFDDRDRMYVVDSMNRRIQVFQYVKDAPRAEAKKRGSRKG